MIAFSRPSGTGGGGFVASEIAFVDSNGNDTTGDGTASAPWATAQKAFDEGFNVIHGGVGSFGNIVSLVPIDLMLLGVGAELTIFGDINAPSGSVRGNGKHMVTVASVNFQAEIGGAGIEGPEGNGYVGGDGGNGLDAVDSYIGFLNSDGAFILKSGDGGVGGNGIGGGGNGGSPGAAAKLTIEECTYDSAYSNSGDGGNGGEGTGEGANGGNGANNVNGGQLELISVIELGEHNTAPGNPGLGGVGSAMNGTDGSAGGTPGASTITRFSECPEANTSGGGFETVTVSLVAGLWVPGGA